MHSKQDRSDSTPGNAASGDGDRYRGLREVSRALTSAEGMQTVLDRICRIGLDAGDADGVYVEQVDPVRQEVLVAAGAGWGHPPLGLVLPFPGSLAEEVLEKRGPEIIDDVIREGGRPIAEHLERACGRCKGLVVPLISEDEALGALVLLRRPERQDFAPDEVRRLVFLADLAALALRREIVAERAQQREEDLRQSERRFRLLVEQVRDYAIFMLDPDGHVVSWNHGAERIKGYTAEEAVGKHFSAFYPEEDRRRGRPEKALRAAAESGSYQSEGWRVRKDGTRFWAHVVLTPIRDERGVLEGFSKVTRDLSERRAAEDEREELRASEQEASARAAAVLDHLTDAFFAVDQDWHVTYLNRQGEALVGRPRGELLGQDLWQVFPGMVGGTFWTECHRALREQRPVHFEEAAESPDRWVEVVAYPSGDGLAINVRDVTERRRTAEALELERRRLRAVLEALPVGVFISDASGRIIEINRAAQELWDGEVLPGGPEEYGEFRGYLPGRVERLRAEEWALARVLATGEAVVGEEVDIETFAGRRKTILNYAMPILDEARQVSGAVVVNVDITARKRAAEAERFLAQATRTLASSLDYEATLRRVARLAVPHVASWCVIYVLDPEGTAQTVEVAHEDPETAELVLEMQRRYPLDPGAPRGAARVMATGEPELIAEVSDALLQQVAKDEEHLRILRSLGVAAVITVPMAARGRTLGAITMAYSGERPRPGQEDVELAQDLAQRAALAVDNARLFQASERRASEEAALRRATHAVSATWSMDAAIRQIAESALEATIADKTLVEGIDPDTGEVVVWAAAGGMAPPVDTRVAYAGSLVESAIRGRDSEAAARFGNDLGRPLPPHLAEHCPGCTAVALPLMAGEEPIGALVLLRRSERATFTDEELTRARTFAELVSLAFGKLRLIEEAQTRREELEQVMQSRERMIRGFTHDLRNPLGAADGFAFLLAAGMVGDIPEKARESVARMRNALRSAMRLIDDLLELARVESEEVAVDQVPVDVRAIAHEMAEEHRARAEACDHTLTVRASDTVPPIRSDPERIKQVMGNLLSNAVKYTPPGGAITVCAAEREIAGEAGPETWVAMDVSDTGIGVPAEVQDQLFREFSRLEPMAAPGAGLGLAISRRVARLLGGDITVDSEPGRGSTFTLWLPADPKGGA